MEIKLRIIPDGYNTAAFNMSADMYLLKRCVTDSIIFVRFYHWSKPTITIGYNQSAEKLLDINKVMNSNVTWIRRPTGGRAVLHDGDITYSCVFSKDVKEMGKTISETYGIISECLKKGLEKSGIISECYDSSLVYEKFSRESKLPCFLAPNRNEIMVNNKKLVGSAQKRNSCAVLQHGSIPLNKSFSDLPLYQRMSQNECFKQKALLNEKCTCIDENIRRYTKEKVIDNLINGFIEVLSLPREIKSWTKNEKEEIQKLSEDNIFVEKWLH